MPEQRFRSRRLRLICKFSHRFEVDRVFGHLLHLRQLKGLRADVKRRRLVKALHRNLGAAGEKGVQDDSWSMPQLCPERRTARAGPGMCYDFRSCRLRLPPDVFSRLVRDSRVRSVQGGSSWMPCTATPRCLPEAVARAVFEHHTRGADFDAASSGAEWWTQVRENGSAERTIKFHWDADEFGLDRYDVGVHPHLSTVTYLSDCGTPTLVLDRRGLVRTSTATPAGRIRQGLLSYASSGKHIVFDGQLLHGNVPDDAVHGERVTFLVNVWLNHRPSNSIRLPADLASYFGSAEASPSLTPLVPPTEVIVDPAERTFQARVERHIYRYDLQVQLPGACETAILEWSHGATLSDR